MAFQASKVAVASLRLSAKADPRILLSSRSLCRSQNTSQSRSFSTKDSENVSYSPTEWFKNRQLKKEAAKFQERIQFMSTKDDWTIGDMKTDLDEAVQSWTAKMPVIGNSKEVTAAKKMHKTVEALAGVMGLDATSDDLAEMTHRDKLKAAIDAEADLEDLDILIQQFYSMSVMHKVVRKRHLKGKKLPESAESVQTIMQVEARGLLSKDQKKKMAERSKKMIVGSANRRR